MAEDTRWIDLLRKIGFGQGLHEPLRTKVIEEGYEYLRVALAAHDAEVKAEALEEAATSLEGGLGVEGTPGTLYEYRAWLRARAAAIRGEQ